MLSPPILDMHAFRPRPALVAVVIAFSSGGGASLAAGAAPGAERTSPGSSQAETVTLSPFEVTGDRDVGYQGGNTTSGSRLNASLKDTAAAIFVVTPEFLSDFAATTFQDMLAYAPGMQLDFWDTIQSAPPDFLGQSNNLNAQFRVRGLRANQAVDFFETTIPIDSYNTGRFELSSGPNSILFGMGSAGGIVNISSKLADVRRSQGMVRTQVGSWDHRRFELDHNQVLLRNRLALRLVGVRQNSGGWRLYDFSDIERGTASLQWVPWKGGALLASFEHGEHRSHVSRPANPRDQLRLWKDSGSPVRDANTWVAGDRDMGLSRSTNIRYLYVTGGSAAPFVIPVANVNNRRILESLYESTNLPVTARAGETMLPPADLPFEFDAFGPGAHKRHKFNRVHLRLQQSLGRNGALEVAYNDERSNVRSLQSHGPSVSIFGDPNTVLPNPNGSATTIPNPNAGGWYFDAPWGVDHSRFRNQAARAALSYKLDLGQRWGVHHLAALMERGEYGSVGYPPREILVDDNGVPISNAAVPEHNDNLLTRRHYVTRGRFETYYIGDARETVSVTINGKTYHSAFINQNLNRSKVRRDTDSLLLATQSYLWDRRIVITGGLRLDWVDFNEYASGRLPADDPEVLAKRAVANSVMFTDSVAKTYSYRPQTLTLGGVFHVNPVVSVFYNHGTTYGQPGYLRRILPDFSLPPPPDGITDDAGFMLNLREGRVFLRATAFETKESKNTSSALAGAQFGNRVNRILDALLEAGHASVAEYDDRYIGNTGLVTATGNVRNRGIDTSLSLNPTPNLTALVNFSYTRVDRSNIAPEFDGWFERESQFWLRRPGAAGLVTTTGDTVATEISEIERYMIDYRDANGFGYGERPYKANASVRYTFTSGLLNRAFFGGGARWASRARLGRVISGYTAKGSVIYGDSIFGPEDFMMDAFVGYRTRLALGGRKQNVTVQLNLRNLTDEDVFQPLRYNDTLTGVRRGLMREPRSFRVTFGIEY